VKIEAFPREHERGDFTEMFNAHGMEVRGRPFDLAWKRYYAIEQEGRLVWVVARYESKPVGYSCSFWYQDLHFNERVAADDMWYVTSEHRGKGVGLKVKECGHSQLKRFGVVKVYDAIRGSYSHPKLMKDIGFEPWGTRWIREL